jgi:hypothetical protein
MGWRYILVNHTRKVIEDMSLYNAWKLMNHLMKTQGWEESDNVEIIYEENEWDRIGKLVVAEGYKSHYHPSSFDAF